MTQIDKYVLAYRETIDDLSAQVDEKASLEERLEEVRSSIYKLRQIANSLSSYRGLDPKKEYPHLFVDNLELDQGITYRVRDCFKPGVGLSATQVRDALVRSASFDLKDYKNPLATIHTILKRLMKAGELFVVPSEHEDEPTVYMMPPAETIPVAKRVTERLKKKRPAWAEYLAAHGGLIISNPPYFASGKSLTRRQQREVDEIMAEQPDKG